MSEQGAISARARETSATATASSARARETSVRATASSARVELERQLKFYARVVLPARALFSDTFGVVTSIAPVRDLTLVHGWQGADGRRCDTPRRGKGTSLGGFLPKRSDSLLSLPDFCPQY
jgi:hypothetical protein